MTHSFEGPRDSSDKDERERPTDEELLAGRAKELASWLPSNQEKNEDESETEPE